MERHYLTSGRYNLIASSAIDPSRSSLIFCCHMDTVVPSPDQLDENGSVKVGERYASSFADEETGHAIYYAGEDTISGLGAVDMKGGIAALLQALTFFDEIYQLPELTIIFYCDEEEGFLGMKKLIEDYHFESELAVFTEPTDLKIANGCRGLIEFTVTVYGSTAHAAVPSQGINAIRGAGQAFEEFAERMAEYAHPDMGISACNLGGIEGGVIQGSQTGWKANKVPDIARLQIEVRPTSVGLNAERAITVFREIAESKGLSVDNEEIVHNYSPFWTEPSKLKDRVAEAGFEIDLWGYPDVDEEEYQDLSRSGYYDAEIFTRAFSVPCISFGLGPSDAAHKENEYVSKNSMDWAQRFFCVLIIEFSNLELLQMGPFVR